MHSLVKSNEKAIRQANTKKEDIAFDEGSRSMNRQIGDVNESFKRHGHVYLAILNLATQLSSHPVVQTLMNICNRNRSKSNSKNASQPNYKQPNNTEYKSKQDVSELWKKLGTAALTDYRLKVHDRASQQSVSDVEKRAE